jgi:hypothetical protein
MWVWVSEGSDERIDVFGRAMADGTIAVLHVSTGEPVTRMDVDQVYPVGSPLSVKYEHPQGLVLRRADAERMGLEIEEGETHG